MQNVSLVFLSVCVCVVGGRGGGVCVHKIAPCGMIKVIFYLFFISKRNLKQE